MRGLGWVHLRLSELSDLLGALIKDEDARGIPNDCPWKHVHQWPNAPLLFCQVRHRHSVNIKAGKVEHKKKLSWMAGERRRQVQSRRSAGMSKVCRYPRQSCSICFIPRVLSQGSCVLSI